MKKQGMIPVMLAHSVTKNMGEIFAVTANHFIPFEHDITRQQQDLACFSSVDQWKNFATMVRSCQHGGLHYMKMYYEL